MERNKEIAGEILRQLGGNKFIAMTGAKNFFCDDKGNIGFKIGRNCSNVNYVSIKLNSLDLYDMKFEAVRLSRKDFSTSRKVIAEHNGIYNDQLQEIFTSVTGMHTKLF